MHKPLILVFGKPVAPPLIKHDEGAGKYKSHGVDAAYTEFAEILTGFSVKRGMEILFGSNASAHFQHYLSGEGKDLILDFGSFMQVTGNRDLYQSVKTEVIAAVNEFLSSIKPESSSKKEVVYHSFSSKNLVQGYIEPPKSEEKISSDQARLRRDWYYAVGGYSVYVDGQCYQGTPARGDTGVRYVEMNYRFVDRYNWDKSKSISGEHFVKAVLLLKTLAKTTDPSSIQKASWWLGPFQQNVLLLACRYAKENAEEILRVLRNVGIDDSTDIIADLDEQLGSFKGMGELHLQGLAKEYNITGNWYSLFSWRAINPSSVETRRLIVNPRSK